MSEKLMKDIISVLKDNRRPDYGTSGYVFLNDASDFGLGGGISPVGRYRGFIVDGGGVTIDAIDYGNLTNASRYLFAPGQDISDFTFTPGAVYFLEFSRITVTAGGLMLIRA